MGLFTDIVQGASSLAQTVGGFIGARKARRDNDKARYQVAEQNQADRDFAQQMWHMQNAYNAPQAQMARFKEAGLNPNLMYGHMSNAVPMSIPQSKPMPAPNSGQVIMDLWRNVGNNVAQFLNNDLLIVKAAHEAKKMTETDSKTSLNTTKNVTTFNQDQRSQERHDFDIGLDRDLRQTSMDAAKEALNNMRLKNVEQTIINEYLPQREKQAVLNMAQQLANMKSTHTNQELEAELKRMHVEMRRNGIEPSDHILVKIANALGINVTNVLNAVKPKNQ